MIIGEIRRYLRDNNAIRVSRSLRDTAYKALSMREAYVRTHQKEPTIEEIAEEIGIEKEDIVYALDAIQSPMSLYEPVYSEGGDTLYVMDQLSDKKNREENWVQGLAPQDAIDRLSDRERHIINLRFFQGRTQMEVADEIGIFTGTGKPSGKISASFHEKLSLLSKSIEGACQSACPLVKRWPDSSQTLYASSSRNSSI